MTLVERYLLGEFSQLNEAIPVLLNESELTAEKDQKLMTVNGETPNPTYQLDLGAGQTFACIGYKVHTKDGRYGVIDPQVVSNYRCMYCLKKMGSSLPLGIPLRRQLKPTKDGVDNYYYHMIDVFCRFECVYAEIKRRQSNQLYAHSLVYLGEIYHLFTKKDISELTPASDYRLLKMFNGPLSWEEFHRNSTVYSSRPGNVFFVPVIEYLEQETA